MKKLLALTLSVLMLLSLCACGSKNASDTEFSTDSYRSTAYSSNGGFAAAEAGYMVEDGIAYEESSSDTLGSAPEEKNDKIIYTADVTIESTDFDASVEALSSLISDVGGFIESSSITNADYSVLSSGGRYSRTANYTVRVPSDKFSDMMSSLSTLGNIPSSNTYSDNISSKYYDAQAHLNNLQAQEQRLVELLDMAQSVSDVIEIESELSNVRYEIESIQTTLNSWDKQVSYSTIYVYLEEVGKFTPDSPVTFGEEIKEAVLSGIETLKDFVLWLISALPVLILIGAAAFGIIKLIGTLKRKKSGSLKKAKSGKAETSESQIESKNE